MPAVAPTRQVLSFAEKDEAIIAGAIQNMNDDHLCNINAVEDQLVAVNASTEFTMFIARYVSVFVQPVIDRRNERVQLRPPDW